MRNIVFIIDHLGQGGAQKILWHLATTLSREKQYQIAVVSLQKRNIYSKWFEKEGIRLIHCDVDIQGNPLETATFLKTLLLSGWKLAVAYLRLVKLIQKTRPDVITTFLFGADFFGALAGYATGTKVVCAIRATNVWKRWWHKLASRLTYPLVDQFTVNSSPSLDYLRTVENVRGAKISCIFNGVDLNAYDIQVKRETLRSIYGIGANDFWIVAAGRLDEQKGFGDLVQAADMLREKGVCFILSIFGEGSLRTELEDRIRMLGLNGCVRLEGYVDNLPSVFKTADLFALSSVYEGMPNVILEAMASGLPVVSTQVDGACDIIKNGWNGLLVPPASPKDFSDAIFRLYQNPEKGNRCPETAMTGSKINFP